ncbi:Glutamate/glutamine/aspartate/asparagine transport system permease protein bztC [Rhodovulum sp. P5]|nr:Glutamate/glutamine/aspartate/asparagine transport system permease protein bztC [Rhodovulum sp. P5]
MSDVSFVRTEMVPEQAPPASSVGVIGWLRENLFSSWLNGILTVLSLAFIYSVLSEILPWLLHSSWTANSLDECRQQIKAAYGATADGACLAVIRERWLQLIFGFYPSELYWRPILAFALAMTALAPVLFTALPRIMLRFSLVAPFLVPWLLWGGTLWTPVAAALGFVFGALAFRLAAPRFGPLVAALAAGAVPVLWWLFLAAGWSQLMQGIIPLGIEAVPSRNFGGFMLSITIGLVAITVSLPIGVLLALGRQSNLFIIRSICTGFIELIRGVPLITLLFVASVLLNYFMPPGTNFDIILRVIIMVTIFASAYMAEVVRGGWPRCPRASTRPPMRWASTTGRRSG